jgi:hypothetical protein
MTFANSLRHAAKWPWRAIFLSPGVLHSHHAPSHMLSPDRFEETLMKRITVGSIVIFMLVLAGYPLKAGQFHDVNA